VNRPRIADRTHPDARLGLKAVRGPGTIEPAPELRDRSMRGDFLRRQPQLTMEQFHADPMKPIVMSGQTFECTARPYSWPWPHGLGVGIDVTRSGNCVGSVHVMCASDQPASTTLASLTSSKLCDLALSRFVAGDLPVTLEAVMRWQEEIGKLGFDYVSPLSASFERRWPVPPANRRITCLAL
jgi:hypothetical protein